jgi:hypothetical protein
VNDFDHNVLLSYMYRDAGNFKQHGEVIFANPDRLSLAIAEEMVSRVLIDRQFFVPTEWSVPLIYGFAYDPELDHSWYEVTELSFTEESASDDRTLLQFLDALQPSRGV